MAGFKNLENGFGSGGATLSAAIAVSPTAGNWLVVGAIKQNNDQWLSACAGAVALSAGPGIGDAVIANAAFAARLFENLYSSGVAPANLQVRKSAAGAITGRYFYGELSAVLNQVGGGTGSTVGLGTAGSTAKSVTARCTIATPPTNMYSLAVFFVDDATNWQTRNYTSPSGQVWSEVAFIEQTTACSGIAIAEANGLGTATADCILFTSSTGGPVFGGIYAFASSAGAAGTVTVNPGLGQLAIRGLSATLNSFRVANVATAVGNLQLNGQAPTTTALVFASTTPGVGNISINGAAPSAYSVSSPSPAAGNLSLNGAAPSTTAFRIASVTTAVGNLSIRGAQPTAFIPAATAPSVGNLALLGQAPTTTAFRIASIAPATGNIALQGFAVTAAEVAVPSVGNISLNGLAPTTAAFPVASTAPGVGNLALRGLSPTATIISGATASPAVGNLALQGLAPTTTAFQVASVATVTGNLALQGNAPTASGGAGITATVNPGVGNLELYGDAPSVTMTYIHTHKSLRRQWRGPGHRPKRDWMQEAEMEIINALLVKPRRRPK